MSSWRSWSPVLIRLAVGPIFLYHGWDHLNGLWAWMSGAGSFGFASTVSFMPLLPPHLWALIGTILEVVGGLFVLLGSRVRIMGVLLAIMMVAAIVGLRLPHLPAAELEICLIAMCLSLTLTGPGEFSLKFD